MATTGNEGSAPNGGVKSAQRTVRVIEYVLQAPEPPSLSQIVKEVSLPKSSAHALLSTLVDEGVLARHPKLETYTISGRWLDGLRDGLERATVGETQDLRERAHPLMVELSRSAEMICNLGALRGDLMVYIDKVDASERPVRLSTAIGAAVPAHATALGKALLSRMPAEELEDWLDHHPFERLTPATLMTPAGLRQDIAETAERGYAIDREEFHVGITCIAACVTDHRDRPLAALSLTSLTGIVEAAGEEQIGRTVCASARKLSEQLA
ncbi:MAG TPA: IclR family transcriptional regulator [Solirubrobacterales bacterium]|nr:IclR family transcriptional regulator [Solirubrobacterales bacterium]